MDKWLIVFEHRVELLQGLLTTIEASFLALCLSMLLGVTVASIRLSGVRLFELLGTAYVEFYRNTPLLVHVFFFYTGFPALGIDLGSHSEFKSGMLGLGIYTSAFIAEVFRAGIQSIDKGQMEAAKSQGMNYVQAMWHIILPQALRIVMPPLGNQLINLVKNSAILGYFAGFDIMYHADIISSRTFVVFQVYIAAGFLYLLLTIPLSFGVQLLERKLKRAY